MNPGRIVCIVGPTASGKTALALQVAACRPIEIVSADSRQVYRGLDIGTGKPSPAEQGAVPHHGLDVIDPTAEFDAGQFAALAHATIQSAHARERDVLVVGGTGLYVRALLRGLSPTPPRDPALRRTLMALAARDGTLTLHRWLRRIDPPLAARVHANDTARVIRGLEVAFGTGRRLSQWHAQAPAAAPWEVLLLGVHVPVAILDARIATRIDAMLAAGWLDEVDRLRAMVPADAPAWRTVGYRELREVLEGRATLAEAVAATVLATRQFAKRQRTWFRREPHVVWRDGTATGAAVVDEIEQFLTGA